MQFKGIVTAGVVAILPLPVNAQDWPLRPVTMVVPFAAGSGSDAIARIFANRLSQLLGKQVVVENIGGAGGLTAATRVAKSAPDGYQFILGTSGTHASNQALYSKPPYDPRTDFTPVALVVEQQTVLITRKSLPAAGLQDFVAHARAHAGTMKFGSGGIASTTHLACALVNAAIGVHATHVPYRAAGLAIQDMIAGHVDYACPLASGAMSQIEAGQVNAVAMLSSRRSSVMPNLASAAEQGLNLDGDTWNAFFLPKGVPAQITQKLNAATIAAMNSPDVQERLKSIGVNIVTPDRRSPEYLAQFVRAETEKWAAVVKAAGIEPQ
jgi:tripartite-type tricarboxylate transporter receptor subunit TctC